MNQLQLFVATTEWLRADMLRCLRRLRLLDKRIQAGLVTMRSAVKEVAGEVKKPAEVDVTGIVPASGRKRPREDPSSVSEARPGVASAGKTLSPVLREQEVHAYMSAKKRVEELANLRVLVAMELANNAEDLNRMIALRLTHFSRSLRQT